MSRKFTNQRGFSVVEGLLIVFVVLVLGGGAFFIYKHTSNTAKPTSVHTPSEAVTFAQRTYDTYLIALNNANRDPSRTQPVAQVGLTDVKDSLAAGLYAKAAAVTQATPFSCTTQYVTDKYTASLMSSDQTSAIVSMSISNGSGQATTGMHVAVDLASLKISSVTCPS